MQQNSNGPLSLLLAILKKKQPKTPIASVVNKAIIELIRKLLFTDDYISVAGQISNASDVINILDLMLYLLRNGHLSNFDAKLDTNSRARRLMMKIITKTPVMPRSLFVTEVSMKSNREYIGGGGFGHVFKGKLGGEAVALKVLYKTHDNIDFCREALMWRSLNHRFVLPFLGIYETESASQFFLVSPYMKNGTLSQWRKNVNPSIAHIRERTLEVAHGIQYIHSAGIVHGDLRGDNVLLDANFHAQISDFGLTRHSEATVTGSGSLQYNFAAPELFGYLGDDDSDSDDDAQLMARSQRSDIYAFGCLYYEIHYNAAPFEGLKEVQIMRLVSQGVRPPRREEPPLSDRAWELIQCCWVREAMKRPKMQDIAERMTGSEASGTQDGCPLSSLLSTLRENQPTVTPVVNATTIEQIRQLLSKDECVNISANLTHASDVDILLSFMLHTLRNRSLLNLDATMDVNRRARRLMSKIITKIPVVPRSLFLIGVAVSTSRGHIDEERPGCIVKGNLQGSPVALKVLYKGRHTNVNICREALMWRSLNHEFVLPFLGVYEDETTSQSFLVTPYMTNGTLAQWRKKANPPILEVQKRLFEVAQGIHYIHSEGMVHRSLHGDNILLDADLHVQIADFGLTRHSQTATTCYNFMAPELFEFSEVDVYASDHAMARMQKSDIYAFGSLYYEVHYDKLPFAGESEVQIMVLVSQGVYPTRLTEPRLSDDAWALVRRCWTKEMSQRPAIQDVLKCMMTWDQVPRNGLRRRGALHHQTSSRSRSLGSRKSFVEPPKELQLF